MPFLMVPREVTATDAIIWVGVVNETDPADPATLGFRSNGVDLILPPAWQTFTTQSGNNAIRYIVFNLPGLQPRTDYLLELFRGPDLVASGRVRTLPAELPAVGEQPFTVMLASCFCSRISGSASIGSTYLNLTMPDRPDVKILCGDQVYLDDPALHFTFNTHSAQDLEDLLFSNYLRTWTQTGVPGGNQQVLSDGANFFTADDHEFWNNAPNFASFIPDTFKQSGRNTWWGIASTLLRIFQTDRSVKRFAVGPVSFFLADTRVNRAPGKNDFMSLADLNELQAWVNGLSGLGVLVIGQPLFAKKAGFFASTLVDKNLSNYKQYEDLVRVLDQTTRSIIVLTGDVHFGRIAHVQLAPNVFLYEIISSPTSLVDPRAGQTWEPPPELYPPFAVNGVVKKAVSTNMQYTLWENHFLTLGFFRDGAHTRVTVKSIRIPDNGQLPMPQEIADLRF
jgi:phosphodiesterase/alkaline phosphatase D-like protein